MTAYITALRMMVSLTVFILDLSIPMRDAAIPSQVTVLLDGNSLMVATTTLRSQLALVNLVEEHLSTLM